MATEYAPYPIVGYDPATNTGTTDVADVWAAVVSQYLDSMHAKYGMNGAGAPATPIPTGRRYSGVGYNTDDLWDSYYGSPLATAIMDAAGLRIPSREEFDAAADTYGVGQDFTLWNIMYQLGRV